MAYIGRRAKDNNSHTGKAPLRYQFYNQMEELLGGRHDIDLPVTAGGGWHHVTSRPEEAEARRDVYSPGFMYGIGWEQYLNGLRGGKWGDQLALIGIANAFGVAVSIVPSRHADTDMQYTHPHNNGTVQPCISLGNEVETHYFRLDRRMHQKDVQASS